VAGQAVASAISELFGDGWGVMYNDVDVFRHYCRLDEDAERREKRESLRVLDTVRFTALEVEIGNWTPYTAMREIAINRREKYTVVKTSRDEMVNTVYYDHGRAKADASFLSTFDINAGQVGVDITSRQLVWTPEFERYRATRQLEIVTLHTPYQSLIRYFKKREELEGTYGNDARMTEMIGLAYAMATSPAEGFNAQEDASLRWRFGPTIARKLENVQARVLENFEVVSETVDGLELHQLVPRFEVDGDMRKLVRRQADVAHLLPRLSRTLRESRKKSFVARAQHVTGPTIALDGKPDNTPHISQVLWLQRGDSILEDGTVTVEALNELDEFVYRYDLNGFFFGRTLAKSLEVKRQIELAAEQRGHWLYGALGLMTNEDPNAAFNAEDWLDGFIDREETRLDVDVVERILPDGFMVGTEVIELFNRRALLDEGIAMHHCVGHHSYKLPEGNARFFSIRPTDNRRTWLTLYLRAGYDAETGYATGWEVGELKGLCNRIPTEAEEEFVQNFLGRFNHFYLDAVCGGIWAKLLDVPARWAFTFMPLFYRNTWLKRLGVALQLAAGVPGRWQDEKGKWVHPDTGWRYWPTFFKWKLRLLRKRAAEWLTQKKAELLAVLATSESPEEAESEDWLR
jgi:hypothetical protein